MWMRDPFALVTGPVADVDVRIFKEKKQRTGALVHPSSLTKYAQRRGHFVQCSGAGA